MKPFPSRRFLFPSTRSHPRNDVGRGHVLLNQRLCLRRQSPLANRLDSATPFCSLPPPQAALANVPRAGAGTAECVQTCLSVPSAAYAVGGDMSPPYMGCFVYRGRKTIRIFIQSDLLDRGNGILQSETTKGSHSMHWSIESVRGHYEVFAADGSFLFSADTKAEAMEELSAWEEELIA